MKKLFMIIGRLSLVLLLILLLISGITSISMGGYYGNINQICTGLTNIGIVVILIQQVLIYVLQIKELERDITVYELLLKLLKKEM